MRLGNYMQGPGFGVYNNSQLGFSVDDLTSGITQVTSAVAAAALEPREIASPSELAGAKLTRGFKITKDGANYMIGLDAPIPGVPANWVGTRLEDPKKPQSIPVVAGITVEYIPPPASNTLLIVGVAVVGLVIAGLILKGKKK